MKNPDESPVSVAGRARCSCEKTAHVPKLIALTGGPGAGKTAVLEVVRRAFCRHIEVLPEAATVLFGGGFPRRSTEAALRAGQRAIFRVQRELERMVIEEGLAAVALCDRGTLDSLAYWPGDPAALWSEAGSSRTLEQARYATVIHLRTPSLANGFDHSNPIRIETAAEAGRIDTAIAAAWEGHPRRFVVEAVPDFLTKVARVVELVRAEIPSCCGEARGPKAT